MNNTTNFMIISHITDPYLSSDELCMILKIFGDTYVYKYDHPKSEYPTREYSARAYNDEICSYSTNEVAINWSAPFAMLLAGINEAMMNVK